MKVFSMKRHQLIKHLKKHGARLLREKRKRKGRGQVDYYWYVVPMIWCRIKNTILVFYNSINYVFSEDAVWKVKDEELGSK